jgi:hypothetical protein
LSPSIGVGISPRNYETGKAEIRLKYSSRKTLGATEYSHETGNSSGKAPTALGSPQTQEGDRTNSVSRRDPRIHVGVFIEYLV